MRSHSVWVVFSLKKALRSSHLGLQDSCSRGLAFKAPLSIWLRRCGVASTPGAACRKRRQGMLLEWLEHLGFGHVPSLRDRYARVFKLQRVSLPAKASHHPKDTDGPVKTVDTWKLKGFKLIKSLCSLTVNRTWCSWLWFTISSQSSSTVLYSDGIKHLW